MRRDARRILPLACDLSCLQVTSRTGTAKATVGHGCRPRTCAEPSQVRGTCRARLLLGSSAWTTGCAGGCWWSRTSRRSPRRWPPGCAPRASTSRQAHDGPAAVAAAPELAGPTCVVLDVMLPGFDGLEVCRRMQAERPGAGADAHRPRRRDRHAGRARRRRRRLPDQAVHACASWSPGCRRCCAGSSGPRELARAAAPTLRVGDAARSTAPSAGCASRRRRGAPDADRVRPAGLPRRRARARCSPASTLLAEVWGWADAAGTRTVDSHVQGAAPQARRRPGPHRARRRLRAGGARDVTWPLDRLALDQAQARPPGRRSASSWRCSRHRVSATSASAPRWTLPGRRSCSRSCVTQLLARGMTSPLREMTAAARRWPRATTPPGRATSSDEVGELARAFNPMAADLGRGRPAAPRPGRQRLARAAHADLRAAGRAGEPRRRRRRSPTRRRCRPRSRQTERLARLVAELLDLSRVDAGVAPLRPRTPLPCTEFLDDAVAEAAAEPAGP